MSESLRVLKQKENLTEAVGILAMPTPYPYLGFLRKLLHRIFPIPRYMPTTTPKIRAAGDWLVSGIGS